MDINDILIRSFFIVGPEKCKIVIFTRRRYHPRSAFLTYTVIPFVPDVTYLGITLDFKLRWAPHIVYLLKFFVYWFYFLSSVAGPGRDLILHH